MFGQVQGQFWKKICVCLFVLWAKKGFHHRQRNLAVILRFSQSHGSGRCFVDVLHSVSFLTEYVVGKIEMLSMIWQNSYGSDENWHLDLCNLNWLVMDNYFFHFHVCIIRLFNTWSLITISVWYIYIYCMRSISDDHHNFNLVFAWSRLMWITNLICDSVNLLLHVFAKKKILIRLPCVCSVSWL